MWLGPKRSPTWEGLHLNDENKVVSKVSLGNIKYQLTPTEGTSCTINTWGNEKGDRPPMYFTQTTASSPWGSTVAEPSSVTNRRLASLQEVKGSFSYAELPYV